MEHCIYSNKHQASLQEKLGYYSSVVLTYYGASILTSIYVNIVLRILIYTTQKNIKKIGTPPDVAKQLF